MGQVLGAEKGSDTNGTCLGETAVGNRRWGSLSAIDAGEKIGESLPTSDDAVPLVSDPFSGPTGLPTPASLDDGSRTNAPPRGSKMMDLIGLPLTSIVLFVLAGILIGHSLWYQDRSDDVEKINWLEKRYLQSRNVARCRKLELRELRRTRDQQQFELGSLRQRYEANLIELKSLERSTQSTTGQLDSLRGQHQQAVEQLSDEQRRSEMLVSQLQEVLQAKSNLELERDQQAKTISELTDSLQTTTPVLETKVQTLEVQLTQSKDALKHAGEDLHARSADLDLIRTQRDTLKQELDVTHQHTSQAREMIAEQEIKLTNVREQLEELLPLRKESAESSLTIAQQRLELAAQQEEVERLRGIEPMSERRAA